MLAKVANKIAFSSFHSTLRAKPGLREASTLLTNKTRGTLGVRLVSMETSTRTHLLAF